MTAFEQLLIEDDPGFDVGPQSPDVTEDQARAGYDEPDLSFVKKQRKPSGAAGYEKKMQNLCNAAIRFTADNPATVPDAAAILMYGPEFAEKFGILAAHDARVARGIDMFTEGTENPYLAAGMAAIPLILQVIRNHEPELVPTHRGIRIPFMKDAEGRPRRIQPRFKIGLKLGRVRALTHDPKHFYDSVFTRENRDTLKRQGVDVAPYGRTRETQRGN